MSNDNEYQIVLHEKARAMMSAAVGELVQAGWTTDELEHLARRLNDRLTKDPGSFGEPHFTLKAIDLTISIGFIRPLCVQIGVQESKRIVFIRKVTLMTTKKT